MSINFGSGLSGQTEMIIDLSNPLFPLFQNRNVSVLKNGNTLIVKMNEEPDRKQSKKKLTFKIFKEWPFKKDFSAERDEQSEGILCH